MTEKATRHSAILIIAFLLISILNYAFGVVMSWFFKPAEYGVLGVAQSLLLLTTLAVGSGFAWMTAHDLAVSGVTEDTRRRFRASWLANVVMGFVLAGGLWLAYVLGWLPLGPAYRLVIPLLSLTVFLLAVRSVLNGASRGLYLFEPLAVNQVGEVIVKVLAGLALVALGAKVAGVMAAFAFGAAVTVVHALWVIRKDHLWAGSGWFDSHVLRLTVPLFVGMLGSALMLNLDLLGLKLLAPAGQGDELAGYYQAAVILARTPVFVAQSLTLVLFTYAAGAGRSQAAGAATATAGAAPDYVRTAIRSWARLLVPIGLLLMLAPRTALGVFFPERYMAAALPLQLAAAGGLLLALVTLLTGVLQAAGDRQRPAWAAGIATLVQVVVLVVLVPRWGAVAAALSLIAAGVVALAGMSPAVIARMARGSRNASGPENEPSPTGLGEAARMLLPFVALAAPLLLLPDEGRLFSLLKLVISGLAYVAALLALQPWRITKAERPVRYIVTQFVNLLLGG